MKHLLVLTVSLIVILLLTIVGVRAIGTRDTLPIAAILDSGSCSQPCWHGVQPGRTTFAEARVLLQNDNVWGNVAYDSNGRLTWEMKTETGWRGSATGSRYAETRTIESVDLIPPRGAVKLGDIVTLLDNPRRLRFCERNNSSDHIHLFFEGNMEVVAINSEGGQIDQLDLDLIVRSIRYYSSDASGLYNASDWQGFVSKNVTEGC